MTHITLLIPLVYLQPDDLPLADIEKHLKSIYPIKRFQVQKLPHSLFKGCFNPSRGQYDSTKILSTLRTILSITETNKVLALVGFDLYAEGLNFVFGEAELYGRFSVASTYRLRPELYGSNDRALFLSRLKKECTHELGHTFGLTHCVHRFCAMRFSNSIYEVDDKGEQLCTTCQASIESPNLADSSLSTAKR